MSVNHTDTAWARRGRWLLEHMTERTTPDGRTVLEISEEPIWVNADTTFEEWIAAVDLAMDRDESESAEAYQMRRDERAHG
jgi:hypothetical protein